MKVEEKFVSIAALVCEPVRAKMLWNLLDGRAYTASELALASEISASSASNHLSKLLEAEIVKVELQGRHRYYSFSRPEVAYAVEALANLAGKHDQEKVSKVAGKGGVKYCRTCYDHLAGYIGVRIADAFTQKGLITIMESEYLITEKGWEWVADIGIRRDELGNTRRPLTRLCLDWSERKPHLAGQFGATILSKMLDEKWFKKIQFSRELIITAKGYEKLNESLGLELSMGSL
jgi:DNA-binding transcriptional ArsR family regulator